MCWSASTPIICRSTGRREIYAREGVDLERSTLADWVGGAAGLLEPLVDALGRYVLARDKLHADDTPVPVLEPGRGKTKTGRLWTYVRDERPAGSRDPPAVLFRYSPDRKGEHPRAHLQSLPRHPAGRRLCRLRRAVRRRAHPARPPAGRMSAASSTTSSRQRLADRGRGARAHRRALRDRGARSAAACPRARAQCARRAPGRCSRRCTPGCRRRCPRCRRSPNWPSAIRYALTRWAALTRYRDDGRIEIDNNAAERALRAVALGRKNYLFAGSDAGGERAAAIYSLIGTRQAQRHGPEAYLRHVLERIAEHPINRIEELLPWNVAAQVHVGVSAA